MKGNATTKEEFNLRLERVSDIFAIKNWGVNEYQKLKEYIRAVNKGEHTLPTYVIMMQSFINSDPRKVQFINQRIEPNQETQRRVVRHFH